MSNFFQHENIFLKVFVAIFLLFLVDNALLLSVGEITEGKVVRYKNKHSHVSRFGPMKYPIIKYNINDAEYRFNGNWDADYKIGDIVPVIYRPFWPRKAKIYTFWGVAKRSILQFIIIALLWSAMYSSFK